MAECFPTQQSLQLDASERPTCSQLLRSELFTKDNFAQKFPQELRSRIQKENQQNPLLLKSMNRGAAAERNNRDSHGDNVKENKETTRKKKKDKVGGAIGERTYDLCGRILSRLNVFVFTVIPSQRWLMYLSQSTI